MTTLAEPVVILDLRQVWHKVTQTRRHSDDVLPQERGNCTQAALASLVGLPLEDVVDHVGYCEPADPWQLVVRRWCRDHLGADIAWFDPGNLPPGTIGLAAVPSLNAGGATHSVVVEVLDAGAVKVVWDPAQWPGHPTYDGMVLPTRIHGQWMQVKAICSRYAPDPDDLLAAGYLVGGHCS